jgi:hypothetical protein
MMDKEVAVRAWQERLGLGSWDITVKVEPVEGQDNAWGACFPHDDYEVATIVIEPDVPGEQLERIIVHELLHLVVRDLDWSAHQLEETLGPIIGAMFNTQFEHELESVVDKLAVMLVKMWYSGRNEEVPSSAAA